MSQAGMRTGQHSLLGSHLSEVISVRAFLSRMNAHAGNFLYWDF